MTRPVTVEHWTRHEHVADNQTLITRLTFHCRPGNTSTLPTEFLERVLREAGYELEDT